MRILHTSDWHLGHRLYERDRTAEHRAALAWLLDTIEEQKVELLVVAGDIFDTMNPSNTARGLYYNFLGELQRTGCKAAIIVGGNHDSPSLLDAPAELMRHLNLHVVGGAKSDLNDQVFLLDLASLRPSEVGAAAGAKKKEEGAVLVAAVPYLRDKDLKYSIAGESPEDRKQRMRAAILTHYQEIGAAVKARQGDTKVPILATGHLFAAGSEDAEDKASHIYLADKNNIEAGQFPASFDYVALGHIHQAQRVGGKENVRYSGSLVPLTFGEARQPQSVCVFDLSKAGQEVDVQKITVPRFRELKSVRGTAEEVLSELKALTLMEKVLESSQLAPWVEVRVETAHPLPLLREELQAVITSGEPTDDYPRPEILRTSLVRPDAAIATPQLITRNLSELDPEDVFYQLCHNGEIAEKREDYDDLLDSFRELRNWMNETEAAAE
ncbi:exonuclease SbcCD subunit D C-terminal domain-containing protein [Neolewinella persica]|uniref:exonuclease SbcCD subunit D C-terminal domain-containing protein n=1 Tax=Neolewinella persica TaxID=70998 RepID=UPI00035CEEAA|nr:exonuclease SbcCD subunit D C-terminal domain-containing protein [Neolewinella persica]